MLIGALADIAGVPSQTIRFYERQGLLPEPRREPNGYRTYDDSTLARVRFIRSAQGAGLTLLEIASIVDLRDHGDVPCAPVAALLQTKLDAVVARQGELCVLHAELERLIERSHHLDPTQCTDVDVCHILAGPPRPRPAT